MKPFAINIKRKRKENSWSQREAADVVHINPSTWASYEEGRAEPSFEILMKICKAIGIPVEDVGAFISDARYFDRGARTAQHQVVSRYNRLKPRQRMAVDILLGIDAESRLLLQEPEKVTLRRDLPATPNSDK